MQSQCGLSGAESSRWEAGLWHKGGDGFQSRQDIHPPLKQQESHGMPCVEWLKSARVSSWSQKCNGGILNNTRTVRRKEKAGGLGRSPTMSTTEAALERTRPHLLADEGGRGLEWRGERYAHNWAQTGLGAVSAPSQRGFTPLLPGSLAVPKAASGQEIWALLLTELAWYKPALFRIISCLGFLSIIWGMATSPWNTGSVPGVGGGYSQSALLRYF